MSTTKCPGEGRKWQVLAGRAVCPVCHRSARSIGVTDLPPGKQWEVMQGEIVSVHTLPVHTPYP